MRLATLFLNCFKEVISPSASSTVCLETENSPATFNNAVSCGSSVY